MLELYQDEACPDCARVRARLGEMQIDFVARQVPPDPAERTRMLEATGHRDLPVLIDPGKGMVVTEADDIIAYLAETYGG
jgi:glutathione S-transferase